VKCAHGSVEIKANAGIFQPLPQMQSAFRIQLAVHQVGLAVDHRGFKSHAVQPVGGLQAQQSAADDHCPASRRPPTAQAPDIREGAQHFDAIDVTHCNI
jgi:hypothetical protein